MLLAAGADVDAQDDSGRTALDMAASLDLREIVAILEDAGADAELADQSGGQPFRTTTAERCETAIRTLVASRVVSNG